MVIGLSDKSMPAWSVSFRCTIWIKTARCAMLCQEHILHNADHFLWLIPYPGLQFLKFYTLSKTKAFQTPPHNSIYLKSPYAASIHAPLVASVDSRGRSGAGPTSHGRGSRAAAQETRLRSIRAANPVTPPQTAHGHCQADSHRARDSVPENRNETQVHWIPTTYVWHRAGCMWVQTCTQLGSISAALSGPERRLTFPSQRLEPSLAHSLTFSFVNDRVKDPRRAGSGAREQNGTIPLCFLPSPHSSRDRTLARSRPSALVWKWKQIRLRAVYTPGSLVWIGDWLDWSAMGFGMSP